MSRFHACALVCAGLALLVSAGCGQHQTARTNEATSVPRVTAVHPLRKTIRRTVTQPGQIQAFDQARLYVKVPAYVEKYLVDIGDKVSGPKAGADGTVIERGQLLAELSAPELEQDLAQKRALVSQAAAEVDRAQAAVKVARAELGRAGAQLRQATASVARVDAEYERWNSEYDRVVQLVARSAVTQKLADETKSQLNAAAATRAESQAKVESARSQVSASEALLEQSHADEAASRAHLHVAETEEAHATALVQYLRLEAPFDGIVAQRNAEIGFFAEAGGGPQAEPLFVIVRSDRVRVFIDLPELDAPLVDAGDQAIVRASSLPGRNFSGTVTRSSWSLDSATRTLHTEIDIENADEVLRPGMYAVATIELAVHENALLVPSGAVFEEDGQSFCCVVEQGTVARKHVGQGLKNSTEVEIISGLAEDDLVVSAKGAALKNGQAVEVVEATAPR